MVMDAKRQNKDLRAAAAQPKDTTRRLDTSTKYSAKISSNTRDSSTRSGESNINMNKTASKKIQGSLEGLKSSASTYLQPNGRGYDNKVLQVARYKDRSLSSPAPRMNSGLLQLNKNYSIMDNYSSQTMKDSSSDRLNSIVDLNMMFK